MMNKILMQNQNMYYTRTLIHSLALPHIHAPHTTSQGPITNESEKFSSTVNHRKTLITAEGRAKRITQHIMRLPRDGKGQSLDPQNPAFGRWRWGIPRASQLARLAKLLKCGFNRRPCLKSNQERHLTPTSNLHTRAHTHTCVLCAQAHSQIP